MCSVVAWPLLCRGRWCVCFLVRGVAVVFWCDVVSDVTISLSSAMEKLVTSSWICFQFIACGYAQGSGSGDQRMVSFVPFVNFCLCDIESDRPQYFSGWMARMWFYTVRHPIFSSMLGSEAAWHLKFCRCAGASKLVVVCSVVVDMCCKIFWIVFSSVNVKSCCSVWFYHLIIINGNGGYVISNCALE